MRSCISILILAACGGGGSGGVSPAGLASALAEASCNKHEECCTAEEFMDATLGSENAAECKAVLTGFGSLLTNVLDDSIEAGRVIYHPDRMEDCLAAIDALSCAEFKDNGEINDSRCEDPFEGQVADGGECANDFDCVSNYCSGDSMDFEGNLTFGVCADDPVAGLPCDEGRCADSAFCDFETDLCEALLADGEACTSDNQCKSEECDTTTSSPGSCVASTTCDGVD